MEREAVSPQEPGRSPRPRGSCPLMVLWTTLALVATNAALYWHPIRPPLGTCLSVHTVLDQGEWCRVLFAPFHHLSLGHLLMNMATLFWLGHGMEQEAGSLKTAVILLGLAVLGGLLHLGLNVVLEAATGRQWYRDHCTVGFSGVLFALEAMSGQVDPIPVATMASGIALTTRWLCILECVIIAIIYPRSSLTGHISGILAGLALSAALYRSGAV